MFEPTITLGALLFYLERFYFTWSAFIYWSAFIFPAERLSVPA
jgi:hypothetical protein